MPESGQTGPGSGQADAVLLSPLTRPGTISTAPSNHHSQPRTTEDNFAPPHPGDAAMPQTRPIGPDIFS
jgi:hypothetical protein